VRACAAPKLEKLATSESTVVLADFMFVNEGLQAAPPHISATNTLLQYHVRLTMRRYPGSRGRKVAQTVCSLLELPLRVTAKRGVGRRKYAWRYGGSAQTALKFPPSQPRCAPEERRSERTKRTFRIAAVVSSHDAYEHTTSPAPNSLDIGDVRGFSSVAVTATLFDI
jgi:hypothetical protein